MIFVSPFQLRIFLDLLESVMDMDRTPQGGSLSLLSGILLFPGYLQ